MYEKNNLSYRLYKYEYPFQALGVVVIPTYNEADNILPLLNSIRSTLPQWCIMVVDDQSPDGTAERVTTWLKEHGGGFLVSNPKKTSLGFAYCCGFRLALMEKFEFIIQMDADHSHRPAELSQIVGLLKKTDVVVGSRYLSQSGSENHDWQAKLTFSKLANRFLGFLFGRSIKDWTSGFKGYSHKALTQLMEGHWERRTYSFQFASLLYLIRNGFIPKEIPIVFDRRLTGFSKNSLFIIFESLWVSLILKFRLFKKTSINGLIQKRKRNQ